MIITKEEVEKAAVEYALRGKGYSYKLAGFEAGVEFIESKWNEYFLDIITENQGLKLYKDNEAERFKELAIEFYSWMQQYQDLSTAIRINEVENYQELFDKFIKERNETNS